MKYRALNRTQAVLEYPLAAGVSLWSLVIGTLALYGAAPSRTIDSLERWQANGWALAALAASGSTLWGLFASRRVLTVARGMYLHMIATAVYGISVISATGFDNGGAVASFLLVIAAVIGREGIVLRRRALAGVRGGQ